MGSLRGAEVGPMLTAPHLPAPGGERSCQEGFCPSVLVVFNIKCKVSMLGALAAPFRCRYLASMLQLLSQTERRNGPVWRKCWMGAPAEVRRGTPTSAPASLAAGLGFLGFCSQVAENDLILKLDPTTAFRNKM